MDKFNQDDIESANYFRTWLLDIGIDPFDFYEALENFGELSDGAKEYFCEYINK